jgi:hypothetical protein
MSTGPVLIRKAVPFSVADQPSAKRARRLLEAKETREVIDLTLDDDDSGDCRMSNVSSHSPPSPNPSFDASLADRRNEADFKLQILIYAALSIQSELMPPSSSPSAF